MEMTEMAVAGVSVEARDGIALRTAVNALDRESNRRYVSGYRDQAMTYAWGWQDGQGKPADSDQAWNFSVAYGWHAYDYACEVVSSQMPIPRAFQEWLTYGTIAGV